MWKTNKARANAHANQGKQEVLTINFLIMSSNTPQISLPFQFRES